MSHVTLRLTCATTLSFLSLLFPGAARAQRAVDAQIGTWAIAGAEDATLYSAALWRDAPAFFGYSFRALGLIDPGPQGVSLYGLGPELTVLRGGRDGAGLAAYATGGVGLAVRPSESDVAALWSGGLGLELRTASFVSATLEARRLVEDGRLSGFWNLAEEDRRGWLLALGFSVRFGGREAPSRLPPRGYPPGGAGRSPPDRSVESASTVSELRSGIVATALAAMGEPYRWGGTSTEDGFDCSGLVWYAYTSHGVTVPRVSRAQAGAGRAIPSQISALEPGDILLFSNRPGVVTHVGLYIGESSFIHATTSGGVRIGSLESPEDGNDAWYLSRWVGARRVLE